MRQSLLAVVFRHAFVFTIAIIARLARAGSQFAYLWTGLYLSSLRALAIARVSASAQRLVRTALVSWKYEKVIAFILWNNVKRLLSFKLFCYLAVLIKEKENWWFASVLFRKVTQLQSMNWSIASLQFSNRHWYWNICFTITRFMSC